MGLCLSNKSEDDGDVVVVRERAVCGGFSEERGIDADLHESLIQQRGEVLKEAQKAGFKGDDFPVYEPISCRSQALEYTFYLVKIRIGEGRRDYIHITAGESRNGPGYWVAGKVLLHQTLRARLEPWLWRNGQHRTRADLRVSHTDTDGVAKDSMLDFAISNPLCKSNIKQIHPGKKRPILEHFETKKEKKYAQEIKDNKDNCSFVPFVVTSFGGFGIKAITWINEMVCHVRRTCPSIDANEWKRELIDIITRATLESNANMIYRGVIRGIVSLD